MVSVDLNDDSKRRFIVSHYRYDHDKNCFTQIEIAAFDNNLEALRLMFTLSEKLKEGKESGEIDAREYFVCGEKYAGFNRDSQETRTRLRLYRSKRRASGNLN